MKFLLAVSMLGSIAVSITALASPSGIPSKLVDYAKPMCGTAGEAFTYPGAVAPFGMIQWSPDENTSISGGYVYSATSIVGFGLDHISGAGCPYGGSFALLLRRFQWVF